MDYKCYDEAYDDYYILYHMNPYDNGNIINHL